MSDRLSISEAFEFYRRDYIAFKNQATRTEEMHITAMNSLVRCVGDIDISSLDFTMVRQWKQELDKHRGVNTARGYLIKLRVVLVFLQKQGYDCLNPEMIELPKRQQTKIAFLEPEEITLLIETMGIPSAGYNRVNRARNQAIISLLYSSGVRNNELCELNINDIPEVRNSFTVIGKGNKVRPAYIDERSRDLLNKYLSLRKDNNPALFVSDLTGKRVSNCTLQEIFKTAKRRSGINKKITPHVMRHSFATNLMHNGADIRYIKEFLGHAQLETTAAYTHVMDKQLQEIHQKMHSTTTVNA